MSNFAEDRMSICNSCEFRHEGVCILCGCELALKTANAQESCPLTPGSKWGVFDENAKKMAEEPSMTAPVPPPPCKTCTRYR